MVHPRRLRQVITESERRSGDPVESGQENGAARQARNRLTVGGTVRLVADKAPLVRKLWLIAMAIVFVALMALVFTFCSMRGGPA